MPDENVQPNIPPEGGIIPTEGAGLPPVPLEGSGLPIDSSEGVGSQQISPEQREELLSMVESVKQKLGDFNAQSFAGKNKTEQIRRETLRKVFEILQLAGVDLTKKESVASFLEKLRAQNQQLADWFETSMDVLLGGDDDSLAPPSDPNQDIDLDIDSLDENNYENEDPDNNEIPPQVLS